MASRHCRFSKEISNEGNDEETDNSDSEANTGSGDSADGSKDEYEEGILEPTVNHKIIRQKKIKKIKHGSYFV